MRKLPVTLTLASLAMSVGAISWAAADADAAPTKPKSCFVNGIKMSPDNCEQIERRRQQQLRALRNRTRQDRRFNFTTDPEFGPERVGGGGDSGGGGNRSDIRLKRDIEVVGRLPNGLKLYRFRYLWSDIEWVGVMAQDVLDVMPEAVTTAKDGFYRVRYDLLGISMLTFKEWQAATQVPRYPLMAA